MPKRGSRRGRGLASRVLSPVGTTVNEVGKLAKTTFKAAKSVGNGVINGTRRIVKNVGKSFNFRRGKATRRRKN
jgi:hypothetical protein